MAPPKQHLRGQSFHSIRRTVEGIYYLAPRRDCRRGLAYTFGLGVEESGVMPHVEITMSNHRQGVATCLTGKRSKFHEKHHGIFALQYNGHLGRNGYMWDHRGPTEPVLLPDYEEDEDEKKFFFAHGENEEQKERWQSRWDALGLSTMERTILYDLMNPISAGLVQHFDGFPGFKIGPADWGRWNVKVKPGWINKLYPELSAFMALPPPSWWDQVELVDCGDSRIVVVPDLLRAFEERRQWAKLERPCGPQRLDAAAYELFISSENLERARAHYLDLMAILEDQFREERAASGKRVIGAHELREQDPFEKPSGPDILQGKSRCKPRFTGSPKAVKRAQEAYRVWNRRYWIALGRFNARRDFNVVFPAGTVRMAEIASVRCRGRPLADENPNLPP